MILVALGIVTAMTAATGMQWHQARRLASEVRQLETTAANRRLEEAAAEARCNSTPERRSFALALQTFRTPSPPIGATP